MGKNSEQQPVSLVASPRRCPVGASPASRVPGHGFRFALARFRERRMDLTHLGRSSPLPASPDEARLDYVPNPRPGRPYLVRFTAPEFTSLCPVTGQPDFAHIVIDYAPGETIVESKSLKLFLGAFRNHAGFHEDVTVGIGERLAAEMKPLWLRIGGYWYPRGGIPIDVFFQTGEPPHGLWVPGQDVPGYRGRG
jgi:7-cyano-7-deazaguanine reductase